MFKMRVVLCLCFVMYVASLGNCQDPSSTMGDSGFDSSSMRGESGSDSSSMMGGSESSGSDSSEGSSDQGDSSGSSGSESGGSSGGDSSGSGDGGKGKGSVFNKNCKWMTMKLDKDNCLIDICIIVPMKLMMDLA